MVERRAATGEVRTLRGLGARLLTEHWARTMLNGAGVVLGVALFTGALITTDSTSSGIEAFLADTTGEADVVASAPGGTISSLVRPRGGSLPRGSLEALAALPGVEAVDAAFAHPTVMEGPAGRTEQHINVAAAAALIGIDAGTRSFPIAVSTGRLPAPGADEVVLPAGLMERTGATVGGTITAAAPDGPHPLRVVGMLESRGLGRMDLIGVTSLETARRVVGNPDGVSQIAVQLRPGVDTTAWLADTAEVAPPGVSLVASEDALGTLRDQVQVLTAAQLVVGAGILFTAGFLIYLTLSLSVAERTRLYGTVHALGATPRQVRRVVVAEALVIGLLGSLVGSALGIGIAVLLRWASGRLLALVGDSGMVIRPGAILAGIAVGVGTTVASALGPARRAARIDAIEAIRTTAAVPPRRGWRVGLGLVVMGGALLATATSTVVLGGAVLLVLLGSIGLVPPLIGPVASQLGRFTARASRGVGRVAVEHLVAERTRSAHTLALVMLVMAMAISSAAIYASFTRSIDRQLDAEFAGGLTLFAASTFPDAMAAEVAEQPGVAAVTTRGNGTSAILGEGPRRDVIIRTLDPDTFFDVSGFRFGAGGPDDVRTAFETSRSVVLPEATARGLEIAVGDEIVLDTAQGPVPFRMAATVELSNIPAVLLVNPGDGLTLFAVPGDSELQIRLQPDADAASVGAALERDLADQGPFLVATTDELKADTRAQIGAGINGFFVLILLAGVVGMFGLANTMVVSVTTRLREIGVLRAVGARRAQVRRMVMIEAVTLVLVALVLAIPLGVALSRPLLQATQASLVDTTVDYEFPLVIVPILAVVGLGVAALASLWPVRRAAATDIDVALRYE